MLCPVCPTQTLQMSERQAITIAHCPHCRGVWLDRGALDTLIARVEGAEAPTRMPPPAADVAIRHGDTRHLGQQPRMPGYRSKQVRGALADLFDL
jgi:uncharacterized protein